MIADIQIRAPAFNAAMVELCLHVLGGGVTILAHKTQYLPGTRLHLCVPSVPGARRPARMQQGQSLARQKTVIDEESLFDCQVRVAALQFSGAIILNAMQQDQVLSSSGCAHRIGLDEAQAHNGAHQTGWLEEAARDRVTPKLLEIRGFKRAHSRVPIEAVWLNIT